MEISVSRKTNGFSHDNPTVGEILVQVKKPRYNIIRIEIDEIKFDNLLEEYIDKIENFGNIDPDLENQLLEFGINKDMFYLMKKELAMTNTNEYSTGSNDSLEFASFINFPWRGWKERLLTIDQE